MKRPRGLVPPRSQCDAAAAGQPHSTDHPCPCKIAIGVGDSMANAAVLTPVGGHRREMLQNQPCQPRAGSHPPSPARMAGANTMSGSAVPTPALGGGDATKPPCMGTDRSPCRDPANGCPLQRGPCAELGRGGHEAPVSSLTEKQ